MHVLSVIIQLSTCNILAFNESLIQRIRTLFFHGSPYNHLHKLKKAVNLSIIINLSKGNLASL